MPRVFKHCQKYLITLCVLGLSACGAGENAIDGTGGAGQSEAGGEAWLIGDWQGHYKSKESDGGSTLRESSAEARFTAGDKRTGTFEIKLPLFEGAHVKGTYQDFAGERLFIKIETSTVSEIGLSGTETQLAYRLMGNALELSNERLTLRLLRKDGGKTPDAKNNDEDAQIGEQPLLGPWTCYDKAARLWQLNMKSTTLFSLDITESGKQPLWSDGHVQMISGNPKSDALLTVTSSRNSAYEGDRYALKLHAPGSLELSRLGKGSNETSVLETFPCSR